MGCTSKINEKGAQIQSDVQTAGMAARSTGAQDEKSPESSEMLKQVLVGGLVQSTAVGTSRHRSKPVPSRFGRKKLDMNLCAGHRPCSIEHQGTSSPISSNVIGNAN